MSELSLKPIADTQAADMRWKDLYRLGAITCAVVVILVVAAVIVFFIWPYAPREISTQEIFTNLQTDRLGGLISLDLILLLTELVTILPLLALYAALRRVNESYALVALVIGLISVILIILVRPIADVVYLSEQYAGATTDAARSHYLASGEALLALFDGTAWMVFTVFLSLSGLISSVLMLRSDLFNKFTAYVGLVASVPALGFFIPTLGPLLLFVSTFGGVVWYILLARTFFRLGWQRPQAS